MRMIVSRHEGLESVKGEGLWSSVLVILSDGLRLLLLDLSGWLN